MDTYEQMNKKTRRNIEDSFINLLQKKSFRKMTIQDISKAANVNRSTFYHHYLDKYDICEKIIKELMLDLEALLSNINHEELKSQMHEEISNIYCCTIFHFIEERKEIFGVLMKVDLPFSFVGHLKALLIKQYNETHMKLFEGTNIPKSYLANFAASALLGLIDEWMKQDFSDDSEKLTKYFLDILYMLRTL
ncbi:TetR/AcrR family transcriptional regulator [Macrococcoides bohemicum]|uniref:TetR/AcrR family transcriptional regulator n=1 Tax=Macrococcoides bohemicum TaxID=1903056 RepID=UPI001404ED8F|nr:TetR/AcrR family transcriptional regulator [Macrococcus bohemicus]